MNQKLDAVRAFIHGALSETFSEDDVYMAGYEAGLKAVQAFIHDMEQPCLSARRREFLKAERRYYEAGEVAYALDPADRSYGCHYGLQSERQHAIEQFYAGFDAAKKNQK